MIRIGIDLGGTKTHIAVVDENGNIQHKVRVEYPVVKEYREVFGKIADQLHRIIENQNAQGQTIKGIGIGVAAQVELHSQKILSAPNLGWKNVDLKKDLEDRFHLPVCIDNDVRSATIGEYVVGLKRRCNNLINIALGTGIGGGIIVNGHLLRGAGNVAGEIGHVIYSYQGADCGCERHGCTEAYAGGLFFQRRVREILAHEATLPESERNPSLAKFQSMQENGGLVSLQEIYQQQVLGDSLAQKLWQAFIIPVGLLTANLVTIFNPEIVILGGGLMQICPEILPAVKEIVEQNAMRYALPHLQLRESLLGDNAMLLGASFLIDQTEF